MLTYYAKFALISPLFIPPSSNGLVSPPSLTCHLLLFLTRQSLALANLLCSAAFTLLVIISNRVRSLHLPCRNQLFFNRGWNTIVASFRPIPRLTECAREMKRRFPLFQIIFNDWLSFIEHLISEGKVHDFIGIWSAGLLDISEP